LENTYGEIVEVAEATSFKQKAQMIILEGDIGIMGQTMIKQYLHKYLYRITPIKEN